MKIQFIKFTTIYKNLKALVHCEICHVTKLPKYYLDLQNKIFIDQLLPQNFNLTKW